MTIEGPQPLPGGEVDDSFLDTPNCPLCLARMEPDETERGGVHWACPACGFAAVA